MLSAKIEQALNDQINAEFQASYIYLSMAAHFYRQSLPGFASWMRHHAKEEQFHAMKIYDFVNERNGQVELQPLAGPKTNWGSTLEVFEDAFKHERHVTELINNLVNLAIEEGDHATNSFLQWYVDEQVEEEALVDAVIQDLERIGDFGPGIYMLDRELAAQTGEEESEA